MQKDLTLSKTKVFQLLSHDQHTNNHHSCSFKQWIVHTRWRRRQMTIDMFKFTDVTASHVYISSDFYLFCQQLCSLYIFFARYRLDSVTNVVKMTEKVRNKLIR